MRNRITKIGVMMLFLVTLFLPNINVLATEDKEPGWTTLAPMSEKRHLFQTEVVDGKIYALGGHNDTTETSSVEVYDPATNEWKTVSPMSTARREFQTEVIDGKIYALGGFSGTTYESSVEVYDPATNQWTTLAPMTYDKRKFQTEVIDGKIYAFGGQSTKYWKECNTKQNLSCVEVYDPATNKWTIEGSIYHTASLQTAVLDGKIYAFGGNGDSGVHSELSTAWLYDPITTKTTKLESIPNCISNFTAEVINGKIYLMGGLSPNGSHDYSIENGVVFDPITNKWTKLAPMPTVRDTVKTAVIDGKIYAIGGYVTKYDTGTKVNNSTEVYDPSTNQWSSLSPMETKRETGFQVEVINEKIYVVGGNHESSMEVYSVESTKQSNQLKVVLEQKEKLQLSIDEDLAENKNVTWTSSNSTVASVDANGVVTAAVPGNAIITVSDGQDYTESIPILVVENAAEYRLAVDLKVGNSCRLTVDDNTNTADVTWNSMDESIATVSTKGKMTAVSEGLTIITASDADGEDIGQVYARVRL